MSHAPVLHATCLMGENWPPPISTSGVPDKRMDIWLVANELTAVELNLSAQTIPITGDPLPVRIAYFARKLTLGQPKVPIISQ